MVPEVIAGFSKRACRLPLAASLLAASPAQAQEASPVSLRWSAPAECPGAAAVVEMLRALRPHAFRSAATSPPLQAQGSATRRDDGRWAVSLHVAWEGGAGQRALDAATCEGAARAAALVIALAMDPTITRTRPRPSVTPAPPPSPDPSAWSLALGLHALLDHASLPHTGAGAAFTAALSHRWARAELGIAAWPTRRAGAQGGAGADIGLVAASLRLCAGPLRARVGVDLCAGVEGGVMHAHGVGFDVVRAGETPWWAALAGAAVSVVVHPRVSLRATVEGGRVLGEPVFARADGDAVHTPGPWFVRASLGVELRVW